METSIKDGIALIEKHLAQKENSKVRKIAHDLKSNSGSVGATKLMDLFRSIELVGDTDFTDKVRSLLNEARSEFVVAKKELCIELKIEGDLCD